MLNKSQAKGTSLHRLAIRLFTIVLTVLLVWVLDFLVEDIRSIRGPDMAAIEKKRIDPALVAKQQALDRQIAELTTQINNQTESQRVVGDSSRNLQQTINQLLELQKQGLAKNIPFSETEQANLASSLNLFLENQRKYQTLGQAVAGQVERKQALTLEKEQVEAALEQQRKPAQEEFRTATQRHRLMLAAMQLAILLPILAIASVLLARKRASIYFPLFLAFGLAALLKVTLVLHQYFPSKYFKYLLIAGLLFAVIRLLIHLIRTSAFPKPQGLVKQYREAYERFLCPVCEFPIRTGPRRFLFWTRATVQNQVLPAGAHGAEDEPYTCPACGSELFAECPECHKVRHTLLPNCTHCGALNVVEAAAEAAGGGAETELRPA